MSALARKHLERRLSPLREIMLVRSKRGWLRAMRDALGMTTRQLALRMGKAQSTIAKLEKSEARETASLASLREAAEAMGCELVYAIVPKVPIDDILRARCRHRCAATRARKPYDGARKSKPFPR